jgi:hypothetical protein
LDTKIRWQPTENRDSWSILKEEIAFIRVTDFIADQPETFQTDILRKLHDLGSGTDTAAGRFHNDQHGIDEIYCGATEVLDASIHIQDEDIIGAEEEVGEKGLKHGSFGTDATGTAKIDGAHLEQTDTLVQHTETFGDIIYARINGEETTDSARFCPGAFFDQGVHLGNRAQALAQLRGEAEGTCKAGRRIRIHSQDLVPGIGVNLGQ